MRQTLSVWLLCVAALSLAGCAGFVPRPPDSAGFSFMVFGDPAEKAAYEQLANAYLERNPGTRLELIHIPSQSDYRKRLGADFAAGSPADVVLINYRRYAAFAERGALEPLGPYLRRSDLLQEADFYPQAVAPFYWEGELMCIPQNLSSLVVYYNRDMFDAAGLAYPPQTGWSWDEFLRAAQALTVDADGDGNPEQYGFGTDVELIRVAPLIWQRGGELLDSAERPSRLALDSPEALAAIQWFVDLQTRHRVVPNAAEEESEDSESRFLNGRLAMLLNSRRGVPTYRTIDSFAWDVAPLPTFGEPTTVLHSDAYCLAAASKAKDEAWRFIEFANSPEGQTIIAGSGRTVPSLRSVAESPAFLDPAQPPESSRVFLDAAVHARALPVIPQWAGLEEIAGAELRRAYYGRASVEEAMRAAIDDSAPLFAGPATMRWP